MFLSVVLHVLMCEYRDIYVYIIWVCVCNMVTRNMGTADTAWNKALL